MIKDSEMIKNLIEFVRDRETVLSNKPDCKNIEEMFNVLIKPLLKTGTYKIPTSATKKKEFSGELFALSVYAKYHSVNNWQYEPKIDNELTPDFMINDNHYLEVYSPALNHDNSSSGYYLKDDGTGKFLRKNLISVIEEKSIKYRVENIIFIIHVICAEFGIDLQKSLKNIKLASSSHQVYLYHGSKEHRI